MDIELIVVAFLTFVIHLIATLAYAVRIAGVRTGRIAVSMALFNILMLVSRTSNAIQAPLLAKRVELSIIEGSIESGLSDFRWIILAASFAALLGALFIPTFQRLFTVAVNAFSVYQSVPKLLLRIFTANGVSHVRRSLRVPMLINVSSAIKGKRVSWLVIVSNTIAVAIFTVGVLSAIYAGYLNPELRSTAGQLSAVVNGVATILLFVFIDPPMSMITDDVVNGEREDGYLRRSVIWLVGSHLAGTLLAQLILVPGARWVVFIAELL